MFKVGDKVKINADLYQRTFKGSVNPDTIYTIDHIWNRFLSLRSPNNRIRYVTPEMAVSVKELAVWAIVSHHADGFHMYLSGYLFREEEKAIECAQNLAKKDPGKTYSVVSLVPTSSYVAETTVKKVG